MSVSLPAATAAAATAAAAATLLGLGHVHLDGAPVKLRTIEGCNGLVGRLVILKGDKTETTRATGVAVADHDGLADFAMRAKCIAQALIICIPA